MVENTAQLSSDSPASVQRGDLPLVLAFPHGSLFMPDDVMASLSATGHGLSDTDWHIERLYDGLVPDVTTVSAGFHRYVIDANRDPSGNSLYPGQNTTTLVPMTDFDGRPIWDSPPSEHQIAERLEAFHAPYHAALRAELDRLHALHGFVILYDCHSIRSEIPFLFDGRLPDFNIGTNDGTTCAPKLQARVERHCAKAKGYSTVSNARFKGGWTTRHYGQPDKGYHAIQMELSQACYMHEAAPWDWNATKADRLRAVLGPMLTDLAQLDPRAMN